MLVSDLLFTWSPMADDDVTITQTQAAVMVKKSRQNIPLMVARGELDGCWVGQRLVGITLASAHAYCIRHNVPVEKSRAKARNRAFS